MPMTFEGSLKFWKEPRSQRYFSFSSRVHFQCNDIRGLTDINEKNIGLPARDEGIHQES